MVLGILASPRREPWPGPPSLGTGSPVTKHHARAHEPHEKEITMTKRQLRPGTPGDSTRGSLTLSRLATALLGGVILLSGLGGCRTASVPEDVRELLLSAHEAEEQSRHGDAILFYTGILKKHPELAEIHLARGDSHMELALTPGSDGDDDRVPNLERALEDFQAASQETEDPRLRLAARMEEAICLMELQRADEAKDVLSWVIQDDSATPDERSVAHRHLGSLLLRDLHRKLAIDGVIAADDFSRLELCREARVHFGEALDISRADSWALFGKGICLYHEQLFTEAEEFFHRTREAGTPEDPMLTYLTALSRERRLRANRESNEGYLRALALDAPKRDFSPVYLKLYTALTELSSFFTPEQITSAQRQLIEYRGREVSVWRKAGAYFATVEDNSTVHLARAVASSRLGEAARATTAFKKWLAGAQPESTTAVRTLELVFGPQPLVGDKLAHARVSLEKARMYAKLFPNDVAAREPGREVLDELIGTLNELPESSMRDELLADTISLLAADLLEVAENSGDLRIEDPEQLLRRAQELTLEEERLRESCEATYRLGRIQQLLKKDPHYPLDIAIQAAKADPNRTYGPAYATLADSLAHLRQARKEGNAPDPTKLEDDIRTLEEVLLRYEGKDPRIMELATAIEKERDQQRLRQEEQARQEAEAQRLENEKQRRREAEAALRAPCPSCGKRAQKSEKICPGCAWKLPPLKDENAKEDTEDESTTTQPKTVDPSKPAETDKPSGAGSR